MKMIDAMKIMAEGERPKGYRVHYEEYDGRFFTSGYFPDDNEPLIDSEWRAWELAGLFADETAQGGKYVNIYVVDNYWKPTWDSWDSRLVLNKH